MLKKYNYTYNSLRSRRLEGVGKRENGRARGRHARGESPSRAPVFSCAHYFQAPATQATCIILKGTTTAMATCLTTLCHKWFLNFNCSTAYNLGNEKENVNTSSKFGYWVRKLSFIPARINILFNPFQISTKTSFVDEKHLLVRLTADKFVEMVFHFREVRIQIWRYSVLCSKPFDFDICVYFFTVIIKTQ